MNYFTESFSSIYLEKAGESRAVCAENPAGEKGRGGMAASNLGIGRKGNPCILNIRPEQTVTLADIDGPGIIRHIWITVLDEPSCPQPLLQNITLQMFWDDSDTPAVDVPLGDFFCCGFNRDALITSQPIVVNPRRSLNCYFPMPFQKKATITVQNHNTVAVPRLFYQIDLGFTGALPENTCYFHAAWKYTEKNTMGTDITLLETEGSGHFVGTYLALTTVQPGCWCEGEVKFYMDGDQEFPTICTTGTEDYFGGAWAFNIRHGQNMEETTYSTLYNGFPFLSCESGIVRRGLYRFHILDPILFHKNLTVTLQQMGKNHEEGLLYERQDPVASTVYWYQKPKGRFS